MMNRIGYLCAVSEWTPWDDYGPFQHHTGIEERGQDPKHTHRG